jgi:glycosyltransferase involved in cell wall biosynthesis
MNEIKVSIVTPSFNQAQFLEETILSVLNQTYKNIEYLIIDGGSTDGSVEIIKNYADKLTYWVSEKDNGQAHAINKGFEKCSGKLFAYLNSDDMLEIDAVEKIVATYSLNQDAAIIYGQCSTIDEAGNIIDKPQGAPIDFNFLLNTGMLPRIYQPACFFNSKYITRHPFFRNDLQFVMDYELLLWLLKTHTAYFIETPIARYRIHAEAKTIAYTQKMYEEKLMIQQEYGLNTNWKWIKLKIKSILK